MAGTNRTLDCDTPTKSHASQVIAAGSEFGQLVAAAAGFARSQLLLRLSLFTGICSIAAHFASNAVSHYLLVTPPTFKHIELANASLAAVMRDPAEAGWKPPVIYL